MHACYSLRDAISRASYLKAGDARAETSNQSGCGAKARALTRRAGRGGCEPGDLATLLPADEDCG